MSDFVVCVYSDMCVCVLFAHMCIWMSVVALSTDCRVEWCV